MKSIESINALIGIEIVLNPLRSGIFPSQPTEGTGYPDMLACISKVSDHSSLKILTP